MNLLPLNYSIGYFILTVGYHLAAAYLSLSAENVIRQRSLRILPSSITLTYGIGKTKPDIPQVLVEILMPQIDETDLKI